MARKIAVAESGGHRRKSDVESERFLSSPRCLRPPDKRIVIIAGPNGAGKTTFARQYLSTEGNALAFLNADEIAAELCPDSS